MSYDGVVVIIPTRNRADLAANAVRSVLSQSNCDVQLLVSDNSTSAEQRAQLSHCCEQFGNDRLRYITPAPPLPMSQHWNWAVEQALALYDVSHLTFLTDRMMFRPGALNSLIEIITAYPDHILTYLHDQVDDFSSPVALHQYIWTGNLYEVSCDNILSILAQSVMYDACVPRMLNCLVPRRVLEAVSHRFGNIFTSISPDWNFAYRVLATVDSLLLYDKAALVHYAQQRSNGQSVHFGVMNEASADFFNNLGGTSFNNAAPFPEIITVWNAIINEYCNVKQVTRSPKFPELDMEKYIQALVLGIDQIKDPKRQEDMRKLLIARGWNPPLSLVRKLLSPRKVVNRLRRDSRKITNRLNRLLSRAPRGRAGVNGTQPTVEWFSANNLEFESSKAALDYALEYPRERAARSDHERLIRGVLLPLPERLSKL